MSTHWTKNYLELKTTRPGFYRADVRDHHWTGYYVFQAIPNSGGGCVECKSQDLTELLTLAEQWFRGETPKGFYSASL